MQFYKIPMILLTDPQYYGVSISDKILFCVLLDRLSLSAKNGWVDENGRMFIIFTESEVAQEMGVSKKTVSRSFKKLKGVGLISLRSLGKGKTYAIYPKNFFADEENLSEVEEKFSHWGEDILS